MYNMFKIYITDCIVQLKPMTLNGCWKKLWPEVFNGIWGSDNQHDKIRNVFISLHEIPEEDSQICWQRLKSSKFFPLMLFSYP
jgi:hypothetical protein